MATNDQGNRRFDDATREAGDRWAGGTQWSESARQVWLAGMGAWSRAQAEGSKLFDSLVRDGMQAEREGAGTDRAAAADVRGFASGTWDRLAQFVEDAVQRSLLRLGVPRREDLDALARRIDALGEELREARAAAASASAAMSSARATKPAKRTARTTGEGAATRKPPA